MVIERYKVRRILSSVELTERKDKVIVEHNKKMNEELVLFLLNQLPQDKKVVIEVHGGIKSYLPINGSYIHWLELEVEPFGDAVDRFLRGEKS